jgi:hypothetical protein
MRYEHKKLNLTLVLPDADELTQGEVERYMAEYRRLSGADNAGKVLRAAIVAGWVREPDMSVDMVEAMKPAAVRWCAAQIDALYVEVITIPPE